MRPALTLIVLALCPAAFAQDFWGMEVGLGVDRFPTGTCQKNTVCSAAAPLVPHTSPAGGSDWDSCTNTLWVTDGQNIVNLDKNCNPLCVHTGPLFGTPYSGLAVDSINRQIYAVTQAGIVNRYSIVGGTNCLQLNSRCVLPTSLLPYSGLAWDAFHGRLWVTDIAGNATWFSMGVGNCTVHCQFQAGCTTPFGSVTGLTYDSCNDFLYMYAEPLFGTPIPAQLIKNQAGAAGCAQTIGCCPFTGTQVPPLSGLALAPSKPVGAPLGGCSGPNCPPCTPQIGFQGLPTIGTTSCFQITLTNAPCPSNAFLFVSLGPCTSFPSGLCNPIFVNFGTLVWTASSAIGVCGGPCTGAAASTIPIPYARVLCGYPLCAQWGIVCAGGGLSLTGPLSITLVGP